MAPQPGLAISLCNCHLTRSGDIISPFPSLSHEGQGPDLMLCTPGASPGPAQCDSRPQSEATVFRSVIDAHGSNEKFLDDMTYLARQANCKLVVCPRAENRNDRWIQVCVWWQGVVGEGTADSRKELGGCLGAGESAWGPNWPGLSGEARLGS